MDRRTRAIELRQQGKSYREIEHDLGIARSTLSTWLRNIEISVEQRKKLHEKWRQGVERGRQLGSKTNMLAKRQRLANIDSTVKRDLLNRQFTDKELEMLFIGLYLGDGFKIEGRVGLGNADPGIVLMFVVLIELLYGIPRNKLKVQIFARVDQDENELIRYWGNFLSLRSNQFYKTQFDSRTSAKTTNPGYQGVCAVSVNNTLLQRRILAIGKEMIKYVSTLNGARSSVG